MMSPSVSRTNILQEDELLIAPDDAVTAMKMLHNVENDVNCGDDNNNKENTNCGEEQLTTSSNEVTVGKLLRLPIIQQSFSDEGMKVQADIVEYWCNMLMQDDDDNHCDDDSSMKRRQACEAAMIEKTIERSHELSRSLQLLPSSLNRSSYGRLSNRLQIASLVGEVCSASPFFPTTEEQQDDATATTTSNIKPMFDWSTERWIQIREQVILLKSCLLRRDANVATTIDNHDDGRKKKDDTIDERMWGQHAMFTDEYKSLLNLLAVHIEVSKFRRSLKRLLEDASKKENQRPSTMNSKSGSILLKKLEFIIDEYEANLTDILLKGSKDENIERNNDEDTRSPATDTTVADVSTTTTTNNSKNEELHKTLTSFLLRDIYNSRKSNDSLMKLPQKLYNDINEIMMAGDNNTSSYVHLQRTLRTLLNKWCVNVLDTPTLVKLGYNVPTTTTTTATTEDNNNDDDERCSVSSWGDDDHDELYERNKFIQEMTEKEEQARAVARIIEADEVSVEESEPIQVISSAGSEEENNNNDAAAILQTIEETIQEETACAILSTSTSLDDDDDDEDNENDQKILSSSSRKRSRHDSEIHDSSDQDVIIPPMTTTTTTKRSIIQRHSSTVSDSATNSSSSSSSSSNSNVVSPIAISAKKRIRFTEEEEDALFVEGEAE